MDRDRLHLRVRSLVAAVALVGGCLMAGCSGGSPPSLQPQQQQPRDDGGSGLPGAVERAGQVKDETNQRTRELEDQVGSYGK